MSGNRTVLGFDLGTIKIGIAVGQEITQTARPLTTLTRKQKRIDWDKIKDLIDQWQAQALIVGMPWNMDGSEQPMTVAAQRFARQLHGRFQLPVYLVDERLTSMAADSILKEQGYTQKTNRIEKMDEVAAQLIVETWLSDKGEHCESVQ